MFQITLPTLYFALFTSPVSMASSPMSTTATEVIPGPNISDSTKPSHQLLSSVKQETDHIHDIVMGQSSTEDHSIDIPGEMPETSIKQKIDPVEFTVMDTPLETETINSDKVMCNHCGKFFGSKDSLKRHMDMGPKMHECHLCEKRFKTKAQLKTHNTAVHTDDRPFKCTVCNQDYKHRCSLNQHIKQHHPEELPPGVSSQMYPCSVCKKQFLGPALLQRHMTTHTGERPYTCTQCHKKFARKSKLTAHIMTHSKNKPYLCEQCGKRYTENTSLKRHVINAHTPREVESEATTTETPPMSNAVNPSLSVQHQPTSVDSVDDIFSNVIDEHRGMSQSDSVSRDTATAKDVSISPEQHSQVPNPLIIIEPAKSIHDTNQATKNEIKK